MTSKEKIIKIDLAIDEIINNLQDGIEISEYEIDNIRIKKRSAYELISELRKMRTMIKKDSQKQKKHIQYEFGRY